MNVGKKLDEIEKEITGLKLLMMQSSLQKKRSLLREASKESGLKKKWKR